MQFDDRERADALITFRVPEWLRDRIKTDARAQRRAVSDYLRLLLLDYYADLDSKSDS